MLEASQAVHSLAVTYAVRDAEYNGKQMKKGQILGLVENKVTVVADDRTACLRELMAQERDMACVTVFYGEEVSDAEAEETHQLLAELLGEDVDLALVPGGQPCVCLSDCGGVKCLPIPRPRWSCCWLVSRRYGFTGYRIFPSDGSPPAAVCPARRPTSILRTRTTISCHPPLHQPAVA